MSDDAWFARRVVNGHVMRGVTPISWQGAATLAGFIAAMVGGGVLFLLIALLTDHILAGAGIFAVIAVAGDGVFLWAATRKCRLIVVKPGDPPAMPPAVWGARTALLSLVAATAAAALAFAAIYALTGSAVYALLGFAVFEFIGLGMNLWAHATTTQRKRDVWDGSRS